MATESEVPPQAEWGSLLLDLKKKVEEQEKTIKNLQRSLCHTLQLFRDLKTTEELTQQLCKDLPSHEFSVSERSGENRQLDIPEPSPVSFSVQSQPDVFLSKLETLRRERSETARHVLFDVFFPHLGELGLRFREKKRNAAELVGSWAAALGGAGPQRKSRKGWLGSLSVEEKTLFASLTKGPKLSPSRPELPPSHYGGTHPRLATTSEALTRRDFLSLCKIFLQDQKPSLLASELMGPVILGRSPQDVANCNSMAAQDIANLNLIAPLDNRFLSFRRDVLFLLWKGAVGNLRVVGAKRFSEWLERAYSVADSETVERINLLRSGANPRRFFEYFLAQCISKLAALADLVSSSTPPFSLQYTVVRVRVLLRLCADPLLQSGRRWKVGEKGGLREGGSEGETADVENRKLLQKIGKVLCRLNRECKEKTERDSGRHVGSSSGVNQPSDTCGAERETPPQACRKTVAREDEQVCLSDVQRECDGVSIDQMLLFDRSLRDAWSLVQRWALRPLDSDSLRSIPTQADGVSEGHPTKQSPCLQIEVPAHLSSSLCESLFLSEG
uniref:Uncharacterized protein n=1 Tax=Chromera velia CCMP2878 TaxID=1169474 RepID=A0A0G4I5K4_9ALVE|eukprot:Cvel_1843.t1-p1 / transcript=Cvel_1843.t1 / gene=Cvel_1843 / organism=Chromera_velia_CCMP2878 / gene_product=hypothetical protein / transcript_product=hypothetical protein / location=Cvel_scaffold68:65197-67581(+) / protein_length=557 / sequence_SO=supercontig / SO=protein_coding / is_pseudo=false